MDPRWREAGAQPVMVRLWWCARSSRAESFVDTFRRMQSIIRSIGLALVSSTLAACVNISANGSSKSTGTAAANTVGRTGGIAPGCARTELAAGNQRFLKGGMEAHAWQQEQVIKTGEFGQSPSVAILSCSDSRVPLEIIFDQGVGDLFPVRTAGFVNCIEATGTFEYGVLALGVNTMMVLGHTKCGAVHATLEGKPLPGSIPMIAKAIQPAVADLLKNKKDATVNDLMNAAVEANVRYQMKQVMGSSEMLRKAQADGKLTLVMAIYDVDTGVVRFLD